MPNTGEASNMLATARESANGDAASTSADLVVTVAGSNLQNGVLSILGTAQGDVVNFSFDSRNRAANVPVADEKAALTNSGRGRPRDTALSGVGI